MESAPAQHTILVVEDEAIIRMSSVATLEDAGFAVLEAGCSAEALEILAKHSEIDVLMTDVCMPGEMNGLALVAMVQRCHPHVRAIVISGNTSADDACNAGAIGFLPKPYQAHLLVSTVKDVLLRNYSPLGLSRS